MFNVPLVGMSMLAHVAIISYKSIFHKIPKKVRRKKTHSLMFNRILGMAIIVFIFSFVFIFASSLVMVSIAEKHSTINFIIQNKILFNIANDIYSFTIKIGEVT